jgi:hypothetical protein
LLLELREGRLKKGLGFRVKFLGFRHPIFCSIRVKACRGFWVSGLGFQGLEFRHPTLLLDSREGI